MADSSLKWASPGKVASKFVKDQSYVTAIRGPIGSGKSVACAIKIFRQACMQAPGEDGIRRTRFAVIRNTYSELKTTTIKTWQDWFPEQVYGKFINSAPPTHFMYVQLADNTIVDCEVIFLALDQEAHIKKLLSLELTGVWINEAREVRKSIVDAASSRCGRYPSKRHGGPSWYGLIMDTNSPSEDHWWGIMAGEVPVPEYMSEEEKLMLVRPKNWIFYTQPAGMIETFVEGNLTGYRMNEKAENIGNLDPEYYNRAITGKGKDWINCYILNRYTQLVQGKAVYPTFSRDAHVASSELQAIPGVDIYCGIDFGRTPAAVFAQLTPMGEWRVLREIVTNDMNITQFAGLLKRETARWGWTDTAPTQDEIADSDEPLGHMPTRIVYFGDPSGDYRGTTDDSTPFLVMRQAGIMVRPAPSNDPVIRIEAVSTALERMSEGKPAFQVDRKCNNLIMGFEGGYHYRKLQISGAERYDDRPNKNRFSHVHDALQYLFLGAGEGRRLMHGTRKRGSTPTKAKVGWKVFG